jgi:hypothetical protein
MSNPREKMKSRLDKLQAALESGDFDTASGEIGPLAKYVHILSQEDRDFYNAAKIGVKKRSWN